MIIIATTVFIFLLIGRIITNQTRSAARYRAAQFSTLKNKIMFKIIIPIKYKNKRFLYDNSTPENDEYIKNFYNIAKEIHQANEMIISISELESQFLKLLKDPKVLLTSFEYEKYKFQFINVDNIPIFHSLETISKGIN